jgi:hypothetical protein
VLNLTPPQGRVKWRRFALVAVPAVIVAGALIGLTAEGAIASSISVSGEQYLITASKLTGTGFEQFGGQVPPVPSRSSSPPSTPRP